MNQTGKKKQEDIKEECGILLLTAIDNSSTILSQKKRNGIIEGKWDCISNRRSVWGKQYDIHQLWWVLLALEPHCYWQRCKFKKQKIKLGIGINLYDEQTYPQLIQGEKGPLPTDLKCWYKKVQFLAESNLFCFDMAHSRDMLWAENN